MEGSKYIFLSIEDKFFEKEVLKILIQIPDHKIFTSLDSYLVLNDENNSLLVTTLLPSLDDHYNPLFDIRNKFSLINILVISEPENSFRIFETFKTGANGFCLKSENENEFIHHIYSMFKYRHSVSASLVPLMIKNFQKKNIVEEILSPKEIQIAKELSAGLSYKLIADKIGLSIDGVRFHLQKIYRKLDINSKGELISLFHSNNDFRH